MRAAKHLAHPFDSDVHTLADLITFLTGLRKYRRRARQPGLSGMAMKLLQDLQNCILRWLTHGMDRYVMEVHLRVHDGHAPPLHFGE